MKKSLVWVVLMAVVLTLDSCKKDDPAPIPAIVGTWTLSKYQLTELPTGFVSYEGYEDTQVIGYEVGYTFVFKEDGTYTRAANMCCGAPSVTDKGTWTLTETSVKVSPEDPDDLDLIEAYGTIGTEFSLVGEITDIRLTLSIPTTLNLLPDAFDRTQTPVNSDFKPVNFTLVFKFNKL